MHPTARPFRTSWRMMSRAILGGGLRPPSEPPPGRSASRRTSRGWGPAVRGEHPEACAGKAGARTASITAHEVVSGRLSMTSLVGAALERMRQHLLHLDDGERGQHPDEAEEQDEEPGEGPD